MPIPLYVGKGAMGESNSLTHNTPYPATVVAGELLLLWLGAWSTINQIVIDVPPAGWTQITHDAWVGVRDNTAYLFARIADGTETGNVTTTFVNNFQGFPAASKIYRFSGTPAVGWYGAGAVQMNDGGIVAHAPTTTLSDERLVIGFVWVGDDNTLGAWTGESGGTWTQQDTQITFLSNDGTIGMSTAPMALAGTISGGTTTVTNSDGVIVRTLSIGTPPAGGPGAVHPLNSGQLQHGALGLAPRHWRS